MPDSSAPDREAAIAEALAASPHRARVSPWPAAILGAVVWLGAEAALAFLLTRLPAPWRVGSPAEAALLALAATLPLAASFGWAALAARAAETDRRLDAVGRAASRAAQAAALPRAATAEGMTREELTRALSSAARDALDRERSGIARQLAELGETQRRVDLAVAALTGNAPVARRAAAALGPDAPAAPAPARNPAPAPQAAPATATPRDAAAIPPASAPARAARAPQDAAAIPPAHMSPAHAPEDAAAIPPAPATAPAARAPQDAAAAPPAHMGAARAPHDAAAIPPAPAAPRNAAAIPPGPAASAPQNAAAIPAAPDPGPAPPDTRRPASIPMAPPAAAPAEDAAQPSLPLSDAAAEEPARDWSVIATALDFPKDEQDEAGWNALTIATRDRPVAELLQASEDALTILAQHGIYMEDLSVRHAPAALWSRFASGERGPAVAPVGGVQSEEPVDAVRRMMKSDPVFRDTGMHLMRRYDLILRRAAAEPRGEGRLLDLADSRTGRAFMLVAQAVGAFD